MDREQKVELCVYKQVFVQGAEKSMHCRSVRAQTSVMKIWKSSARASLALLCDMVINKSIGLLIPKNY